MRTAIPMLSLLALSSVTGLAAQGQVWHVDDNGGADFTTVQAAIDAAADGDTIVIEFGNDSSVLLGPPAIFAHGPADPVTGAIEGLSIALPDLPPGQGLTVYAQGACITAAGDPSCALPRP